MKSVSYEYKQVRKNGSTISTHMECRLALRIDVLAELEYQYQSTTLLESDWLITK